MSVKIANDTANGSSTLQPSNTASGDVTHTLPAFTTELAPRMQLMTAQNSISGTSIDFTGIPSWAKKITVMFNGVSTNGTSPILIQLGSGSSQITGYAGSSSTISASAVATVSITTGFQFYDGGSGSSVRQGTLRIHQVIGNTFEADGSIGLSNEARTSYCIGSVTLSGALDRLRITTVNGTTTFDAGQINVLYEG